MLHKSTMLQEVELGTKLLLDLSDSVNQKICRIFMHPCLC